MASLNEFEFELKFENSRSLLRMRQFKNLNFCACALTFARERTLSRMRTSLHTCAEATAHRREFKFGFAHAQWLLRMRARASAHPRKILLESVAF